MAKYKVAWLPGDGIGNDVLEAAKIVLDGISFDAEYIPGDIGWKFFEEEGDALPERTVDMMKDTDAALFGAITSKPNVPGYRSPIVRLRQTFDLYSNMRPCKAYPGNPLNYRDDIDLIVFRENTEDLYSGIEFPKLTKELQAIPQMRRYDPEKTAVSFRIFTEDGCEKIIRKAFDYAQNQGRKKVTIVHKANVIRETDGMFLRIGKEIAKEYSEIDCDDANVDGLCMWLIKNPETYDVLVASNVFGDIVSDLTAMLVGGLGFAASASTSNTFGLFEPTHGSVPKYEGLYKVNPIAMLLSVKLMFDFLQEKKIAFQLENAIAEVIQEGQVRTYDMGGNSSTLEVAQEVVKKMDSD